jgi:UDP-N-acetylglucosamine--N-acetylmuramyl-(pentapeptide) pyrophosphoryl-undecaprenol N-acetylglucosamine transferase
VPRVLYGVSPIGLGHATRSLVVVRKLRQAGADVMCFSGGKAAEFLRSEGEGALDIVSDPVPEVVGGEMKRAAFWYVRSWLALRRTEGRTSRAFDAFGPDLVVCDEEFSGMTVGDKRGVRRVFISDELKLGFGRGALARWLERRVERWYGNLQASADLLLVPDFGEDRGNVRHVGPIVREVTKGREETLAGHGVPSAGRVVLVSMSGSGIGDFIVKRTLRAVRGEGMGDVSLVVTGNRGAKVVSPGVYDLGVVLDNQNLVAAADLVVSTAGKSTIDEAKAAGTPFIVVPIRHHAEQERNALAEGYSAQDLERLPLLLKEKLGKRGTPVEYNGAERAVSLIISMAHGSSSARSRSSAEGPSGRR